MKWSNRFVSFNFLKDWRLYLAEFLGTFVFVFIASTVIVVSNLYNDIGLISVSLAIGFSYAAMVFITAHISGGYLNPAITVSLWLAQRLSGLKAFFYLFSQLIGSFAAAGVLLLIFKNSALQFVLGAPTLGLNISPENAIIVEAILTAILVFAVFGTMIDRNGPVSFGPLVLGLVVVSETIIALQISGAALNPARALGPLVISKSYANLAIWVIGPLVGSFFGIFYEAVFIKKPKKK